MCGIAGLLSASLPPPALRAELQRLAAALRHRGPDASAVRVLDGAGLAHTRLAILDLSPTGAQPMQSPDGRFWLAYNGEVYNSKLERMTIARPQ